MSSSRRWFAVAAALVVAASSLPAQISWGPAVGLNLATLGGEDVTDASMLMGLAAGVQLDMSTAGKALFWRAGASYSMQGAKFSDPSGDGSSKLAYLNIPILAGWKFTPAKPNSPYLLVGPQIGLNVGCDVEFGGSSASCSDIGTEPKSMDLAAVIGVGTSFAAGLSTVHVAATYGLGLMTTDSGDPAADVKNRVIAFTVSYMMPSKRAVTSGN